MNSSEPGPGKSKDPPGESIGRPADWQEGRYERPQDAGQGSVVRKPGEDLTPEQPVSTPVTQEDYTGAAPKTGPKGRKLDITR